MRCCRRRSGAATGRRQSRQQRPGPTHGRQPHPCRQRSPTRPWRAIWRARCTFLASDPKDRLAAALARLGRAFSRSAAAAEKLAPELDPTCHSQFGPADQEKEDH
jgi:hypothetical protein